jgi:orotidine-5'-phosphate decarboxylase
MKPQFIDMLEGGWSQDRFVCVGLDTEFSRIPNKFVRGSVASTIVRFNEHIISSTADIAGCYKPQSAFYEQMHIEGPRILQETIDCIRAYAPKTAIIDDAKRGDIGNSNDAYVASIFGNYGFDAVTVNPYLGGEALAPFLSMRDKGIIVLCRTSNKGAGEFQDMLVKGKPLYQHVARHVEKEWNENGNCCLVVGATYPKELAEIRAIVGDMPLLIPGIGAQGGDLAATVKAGMNSKGNGMIINSSRGIIYAYNPRGEAKKLNDDIIHLSK